VAELEDFERVFGPLRILNNKEDLFMEVNKKIKFVGTKVNDKGSTMWYVKATDEEFYSTWDLQMGKKIEELDLKTDDIVKLQYEVNKAGYKTITAIEKEIQFVDEEVQEEKIPPQLAESPDEKTRDIHRQVAWKIAGSAYGWFDLDGRNQEERQKLLAGLASTIEEILNQ